MPDLLSGSTVLGQDTPPTVSDTQPDLYNFTNVSFGVTTTGGTYVTCGAAFMACTTGRARIDYAGALDNSSASDFTALAPVVREGATVGSGALVIGTGSFANAIYHFGTNDTRFGVSVLVQGLTPGATYNVRLEHRVGGGTGAIQHRTVIVSPAT